MDDRLEVVKLCPYLGIEPPDALAGDWDDKMMGVKEVLAYFKESSPESPMDSFIEHYSKLAPLVGQNDSKIDQVLRSIRLIRIANRTQKELQAMGL